MIAAAVLALSLTNIDGKTVLEAWERQLQKTKAISGELQVTGGDADEIYRFRFLKPIYGSVLTKGWEMHADGKAVRYYYPATNTIFEAPAEGGLPPVHPIYFGLDAFLAVPATYDYESSGKETFEGADSYTVTMRQKPGHVTVIGKAGFQGSAVRVKLYFSTEGNRLTGFSFENLPVGIVKGVYKNLKLENAGDPKTFAWAAPKDSKLDAGSNLDATLLPIGSTAPDFTLPTYDGKASIKLSDYVRTRKATLLNFYFVGCMGCMIEFPNLDRLNTQFKDKGLGILGVDPIDPGKTVDGYYAEGRFGFTTLIKGKDDFEVGKAYKVQAYPTNYVVDSKMKIVDRYTGEHPKRLQSTLRKLGIPIPD